MLPSGFGLLHGVIYTFQQLQAPLVYYCGRILGFCVLMASMLPNPRVENDPIARLTRTSLSLAKPDPWHANKV